MRMMSLLIALLLLSCSDDNSVVTEDTTQIFTIAQFDASFNTPFGSLPYRVYYPEEMVSQTYAIILSRGGNGEGDDRGELLSYAHNFELEGYVVIQIDHRNAGTNIENIAV